MAKCHYCPEEATTRDHIVPRYYAGTHRLPGWLINVVPACLQCNNKKGHKRSDCTCDICVRAWAILGPTFPVEVIQLVRKEG